MVEGSFKRLVSSNSIFLSGVDNALHLELVENEVSIIETKRAVLTRLRSIKISIHYLRSSWVPLSPTCKVFPIENSGLSTNLLRRLSRFYIRDTLYFAERCPDPKTLRYMTIEKKKKEI